MQEKTSEDLLRSHTKDKMLLTLASKILEKLMPSFQKDPFDTLVGNLKNLISLVDTHFDSFYKSAEEKAQNDFYTKRL